MDVRKSINTVKTMTLGNRVGSGTLRRLIGASVAAGSGLLILSAPVLAATDVRADIFPRRSIIRRLAMVRRLLLFHRDEIA